MAEALPTCRRETLVAAMGPGRVLVPRMFDGSMNLERFVEWLGTLRREMCAGHAGPRQLSDVSLADREEVA